ncbi:hypothetical protein [Desulfobulbus alkaliphilus]|uniref:hypothetical protein n=1 Tax=Desulfobulbus alkaliphilus TaxID=869814 RepID=UPI0019667816|nr:hypothetical protein [Desulfobulbus alkaliphilus]MBM9536672.1 hypothetical protein [Desulfobulbus alkaliphilus]
MKRLQRDSVLISLIEALRDRGSWCGETHMQKISYFLQELLEVPLSFNFILYKHGPYSFDLSDTLAQMEADFLIRPVPKSPYGPTITIEPTGKRFREKFPKTNRKYKGAVDFVAKKLAEKNVAELERIATAMYVTLNENSIVDVSNRAEKIHHLKPHLSLDQAIEAVKEFDQIKFEAQRIQN